jgi:adenylosuccinate synthase
MPKQSLHALRKKQDFLLHDPIKGLLEDYKKIYKSSNFSLQKINQKDYQNDTSRKYTIAVCGVALGDEGKGRIVDNYIETLLKNKSISKVGVIRYQGGNNAGHTLEKGTIKLALHLVPSCVLYQKAFGIMDRGMVIHPEDLMTEVGYVEKSAGTLKKRLFLSSDAILNTDLERAEEIVNRIMTGKAKGGTGRGIGPSYAHHLDRLGLTIYDLISDGWKELLGEQYRRYEKIFAAFDLKLATDVLVPDFYETVNQKKSVTRTVGSRKAFIERLTFAREWLIQRNMIVDIVAMHKEIARDTKVGVVFEGAQAVGLDSWLGTWPDVTASNTRIDGVKEGTAFWRPEDIESRIGVFKIPYTSSVGQRQMPTHIDLPKEGMLTESASEEQKWAMWIREEAHEYGTTTGRPRDIAHLDLEFLRYNARMGDIEMLAGTHLDSASEGQEIKVCTHYTDQRGRPMAYQPGLHHLEHVKPNYISLPGWDGKAASKARKVKDLPKNALRFLSFITARTGYPIVLATTGTKRENIISF